MSSVDRGACPDETQLVLLAEDSLSDNERAKLESHLDGCLACGQLIATLAELAVPARQAPERYRIIRQLGAGAMGVVWEAEDTQLRRRVALKWVTPGASGDADYRTRLFREARALAQLHHPNVVAVHDVGEAGDELYLALELIVGTTARAWLDAKPRTPADGLAVWRQAGAGLAAVHRAGIIHRDIKPDNVFVADDGRVVVGDFGLATGDLGETSMHLTATGAVLGTPLYMPPEQLGGDPATAKGDQFSLCVCIWEALAGRRPFEAKSLAGLMLALQKPPAIPAGADRRIFAALQRGLATEPKDRWPDVASLMVALDAPPSRRRGGLVAIAAAVAIGAGGVVAWQQLGRGPAAAPNAPPPPSMVAPAPSIAAPGPIVAPAPSVAAPGPILGPPIVAAGSAEPRGEPVVGVATGAPKHAPPPMAVTNTLAAPTTPATAAPASGDWKSHLDAATMALALRNAGPCLSELAAAGAIPDDHRESAELMRASCLMLSGDCSGGHAALEQWGHAHWDAGKLARVVGDRDAKYCALDAPPSSAWPERASKQLETLAYLRRSCKPVLDFVAAHHIAMPPDPARSHQMMFCLVADGKCDEARAQFIHDVGNGATLAPDMAKIVEHNFDLSFPSCAGG